LTDLEFLVHGAADSAGRRVQGYAATGLQQLARAAQAPIGSIYHHFRDGKRQVAAAALRQAGAAYIQLLPMLLDQHADL
jgi:AcrR family transcriptional regulator